MINKKILLGKIPEELGVKDAVHVAIVSVRAGCRIELGQKCSINEYGEAIPSSKGIGVADPWRRKEIRTGDYFLLLMNPDEVENVQHTWEHPKLGLIKPTREIVYNQRIMTYANDYKLSYKEIMEAAQKVMDNDEYNGIPYTGELTEEEFDEVCFNPYDFWFEWASEVGYEFENRGTDCCPEYDYPNKLFYFQEKE